MAFLRQGRDHSEVAVKNGGYLETKPKKTEGGWVSFRQGCRQGVQTGVATWGFVIGCPLGSPAHAPDPSAFGFGRWPPAHLCRCTKSTTFALPALLRGSFAIRCATRRCKFPRKSLARIYDVGGSSYQHALALGHLLPLSA